MAKKAPSIPGFVAVSDQILVQETQNDAERPADHPDAILIFGWGDCLPKHVAKYADGYAELFPHSTQVVILAPISKAFFTDLQQRSDSMMPVLKVLDSLKASTGRTPTVLAHAMSNTGGTNYASTLNAFKQTYEEPLPHQLLVLDSTPGSPYMNWENLKRWSKAMTLGTAAYFPWPFAVTQSIWGLVLCLNIAFGWATGREAPAVFSIRAIDDETFETKDARRLFLYSKEDDLIFWHDIEAYRAVATQKGYQTDAEMFEGTGHVGHMRVFPEKYWKAIQDSWGRAIAAEKKP
ncbi:hypothetical protein BGZ61DRAFT_455253 [Ilyonectria robusta]|uniref:uncharacterized protein n=1 Tax=Ilyonectria robusta TaxID=1079257 RepID=UPI001E8DF1E7|nr:uncharacterized protein BGZ61DRAFT_455253 [Ilyonectria robusta]KAH8685302.1 hypothetical protein BGZ61DRAFT_455253 [Ilyonectria robusta]